MPTPLKIARKFTTELSHSAKIFEGLMIYRRHRDFTMTTPCASCTSASMTSNGGLSIFGGAATMGERQSKSPLPIARFTSDFSSR